jgi:hypothetical protein
MSTPALPSPKISQIMQTKKLTSEQIEELEQKLLQKEPFLRNFIKTNFPDAYPQWNPVFLSPIFMDLDTWELNHITILVILEMGEI